MSINFNYLGANSVYIPAAQESLRSDFSQNKDAFPLNKYVTIAKVDKPIFDASIIDPDEESRVTDNYEWAYNSYPQVNQILSVAFEQFKAKRKHKMFTIDDVTQETAAPSWNMIALNAVKATNNLMLIRTLDVHTALANSALWPTANTSSVTSIPYQSTVCGLWSAATSTNPYIETSIQYGVRQIKLQTNRMVRAKDLNLVISPSVANAMAVSDEIRNYVKSSVYALPALEQNENWSEGLPDYLYGVRVIVEDTVQNNANRGGVRNASFVEGDFAYLLTRPGALMGDTINNMSSVSLGMFADLTVDLDHKAIARLTEGNVWNQYGVVDRFQSGFRFVNPI